jgi:hypothetical protein
MVNILHKVDGDDDDITKLTRPSFSEQPRILKMLFFSTFKM